MIVCNCSLYPSSTMRLYLVDSSSIQIVWDERVETPPAVGANTPPLPLRSLASIDWFVLRVPLCTDNGRISCTSLCPPRSTDYHCIPPTAHFRTMLTTCSVPLAETRRSAYIAHPYFLGLYCVPLSLVKHFS